MTVVPWDPSAIQFMVCDAKDCGFWENLGPHLSPYADAGWVISEDGWDKTFCPACSTPQEIRK
jgi:hypothetical protein